MFSICAYRTLRRCKPIFILAFILALHAKSIAQSGANDTLLLRIPDAEKIFLEKNLSLLAQQYNIDISRALVEQAKYWDNPVLNTDQNIYDGEFFRHNSQYGEIYIQIQQIIKTAGKRNKLVKLANDQVLTTQQQFNDLMRNLKYLLRTDLVNVFQQMQTNQILLTEINSVSQLVKGMDAQFQAGNISAKENIRLKSLLYSLQSDHADLQRQIADQQTELHILLQLPSTRFVACNLQALPGQDTLGVPNLQQMLDSAKLNRPDAQLAQTALNIQQHNLAYQKALVSPDLNLGVEYDQRNAYVNNYYGLAISLPLPILNRNKGNIKAAEVSIKQAQTGVLQIQQQVEQEVTAAYKKWLVLTQLRESTSPALQSNYDKMLQNMLQSYQQRQVGLLEFLDFFSAYKDSRIKQLQQETNFRSALEEINLTTGKDLVRSN